jgi:ClpP class serine protease
VPWFVFRVKVCVFAPHYAMSGGRLIARPGDELVMDENAVLGPVDPRIGQQPAVSILKVVEQTPIAEVDDQTLIWADLARKATKQVKRTTVDILSHHMDAEKARQLTRAPTSGNWTHDYPISVGEALELGVSVSTDVPREVYDIMSPIRQTAQRPPSVEYMPVPYQSPDGTRRPSESRYQP